MDDIQGSTIDSFERSTLYERKKKERPEVIESTQLMKGKDTHRGRVITLDTEIYLKDLNGRQKTHRP